MTNDEPPIPSLGACRGGPAIPLTGARPETESQWWRYRAMVYFAVATLHFYRDEILPLTPQQTLGDFADANRKVLDQVLRESVEYFSYELSHEQIGRAIQAWLAAPCNLDAAHGGEPGGVVPDDVWGGRTMSAKYSRRSWVGFIQTKESDE